MATPVEPSPHPTLPRRQGRGWRHWLGPWVDEVDRHSLRADALAGLLGAALVLPQGVAFASLAGLPPGMGLWAAMLPCAVAALAGSSRHVVTGPTNATALAMGAMLAAPVPAIAMGAHAPELVALAVALTLLVGLMQVVLAAVRLGGLAHFIAPSVMLGFTSGAALLIGWYALGSVMGGVGRQSPSQVWHEGVSSGALWVGGLTWLAALAGRRWWRRGPHMLAALMLGTAAGWLISASTLSLPSLGALAPSAPARVGTPPSAWPDLGALGPALQAAWQQLPPLLPMALALTIVALGQSLSLAKAMAARTGEPLDANRECLGQGLANLSSALGGGMVVCGSLNRSLPNLEAGARTPLAGVAAALWLLLLVALAAPVLAWIPLAGVGALLLVVATSLVDLAAWRRLWQLQRQDFGIALTTAVATLVLRLEVAVLAGVMLSLVAYLYRTARPALRTMGFDRRGPARPFVVLDDAPDGALPECPQLKLLRMEGPVWFGATAHVAERLRGLRAVDRPQRHLLVMGKSMNFIDLAGADLWEDECRRRRELQGDLYFHRPRPQVMALWRQTGFLQRLGEDHLFADKRSAIAAIVPRLDPALCRQCQVRVFDECAQRPGAPLAPSI